MNKVTKYLNQHIQGNVYDKPSILEAYATDRSILKVVPKFVALPQTTQDVQTIVKFSQGLAKKQYLLPLTVRGSGLDKTGADLGEGLVISTERMNNIQEVDERSRLVRVQAGVTLEKLNAVLSVYGLTLPIDADPKETIGGLISNFPLDPLSKKYGSIFYFVDRIEAVLPTGDIVQTTGLTKVGLDRMKKEPGQLGKFYTEISKVLESKFDILEDIEKAPRDMSGYQMISRVKPRRRRIFDLTPAFFGAQGSFGVITEVILRCEPLPRKPIRALLGFHELSVALEFAGKAAKLNPARLDLFDARIFNFATEHGKPLTLLGEKFAPGFYLLLAFDDSAWTAKRKMKKALSELGSFTVRIVENQKNSFAFDEFKPAILSFLNNDLVGERVLLVDDALVPSKKLPEFYADLRILEQKYAMTLPVYGSYLVDKYSVRPEFQLSSVLARQSAVQFLREYAEIVAKHGGSLSGIIADGRVRAVVAKMPKRELDFYTKVKKAFDPVGIMNPGIKLGADSASVVRRIRATEILGENK